MKNDKIIFAYIDSDKSVPPFGEGKYKSIVAINYEETEYFSFTVNQDDYKQSLCEMCKQFIAYCTIKCGFSKEHCGQIWLADGWDNDNIPWHGMFYGQTDCKDLEFELAKSDFCGLHTIEFEYMTKSVHLKVNLGFEFFKKKNNYSVENEPYATKQLYHTYKDIIDKTVFTEEEQKRMASYVKTHIRHIFDTQAIHRIRFLFRLEEALARLSVADKVVYNKLLALIETVYKQNECENKDELHSEFMHSLKLKCQEKVQAKNDIRHKLF